MLPTQKFEEYGVSPPAISQPPLPTALRVLELCTAQFSCLSPQWIVGLSMMDENTADD
jgi:hypothetical protein